ncbi:MAG: class I SAM-dependent methyltransferase [Acidimicrobiales bacterium]|jgi:SAM-dependent methyltransferase
MNAKHLFLKMYLDSQRDCRRSVLDLMERQTDATYLDCGCGDGSFTSEAARKLGIKDAYGIEISEQAAASAAECGVRVLLSSLNDPYPFPDCLFDVVSANQVIEHVSDTDHFLRDMYRVLKPGGYAIVSTNNLASWHNVAALIAGYQPFPSDVSAQVQIGKPVALFRGDAGALAHLRIFTYPALKGLLEHHGFTVEAVVGVGYYPLGASLGNRVARLDKRHSAYLTAKVRRPANVIPLAPSASARTDE